MGKPMALNLLNAGHNLTVYDPSQKAMEEFNGKGAKKAKSAKNAIKEAEFIISMLPTGSHVHELYLGENGILKEIKNHNEVMIIDSSTIEAEIAQNISHVASTKGLSFLDAPVSGGVGGAIKATLAFMVGGRKEDFELAKSVLSTMGKKIFYAGDSGSGQMAKACNNMLLAILMTGTSEALSMGIENGLDAKVLSEIMRNSSGSNWALESYNPVPGVMEDTPASDNYQGGFQVDLMYKDLKLAKKLSAKSKSSIPLGSSALRVYEIHKNNGQGKHDFSSIYTSYREKKI